MSEKLKVPDEWCCVNHIDIAEINPKFDINQFKEDVEVSFLPMASVKEISGNYDLSQSRKLSAVKKGYTNFKNGDIIFAKITPCMENGKIAVLDNLLNGMGFGSTEFHVSRPYHDINAQFLFYYFVQSAFRKKAQRIMTGSAGQLRVSTEYFKKVNIPIPPLPEQRAIVSKVEQLFSDLDNGIDNFKKAQEQLKRYRQSVLKAACEGRLVPTEAELACAEGRDYEPADVLLARILKERREKWNGKGKYKEPAVPDTNGLSELPEGWAWATFDQVSDRVTVGHVGSMKDEYVESGIPFLRSQNVRENKFESNGLKFISREFYEKLKKSSLQPGDLVVVRSGSVGTTCVIPETLTEANCSDLVIVKQPHAIHPQYGAFYMNSIAQSRINAKKVGVALTHFNTKSMAEMPIPIPPLMEQRHIVDDVERRLSICDKLETTITESLQKAESLRQSILKKAFEGKLLSEKELEEARNAPDWEPADKLLERIKVEKEKPGNKK